MKSVGCIGILMENDGLVPPLECAFASVSKMLTGEKFLMNVLVLRFKVLELLRDFVDNQTFFGKNQEKLESIFQENILEEHWVKDLILLVFLMRLFVRADRDRRIQNFPYNFILVKKCSYISHLKLFPWE